MTWISRTPNILPPIDDQLTGQHSILAIQMPGFESLANTISGEDKYYSGRFEPGGYSKDTFIRLF
ncbi:hypothetical Protein YC6258_05438 [Gynuella sunshinyii YC6258]|uniref:Uncharacterized protein n=1 Tax=Gynuella sunshinyii YC6258 TaxID=1445510 RepID=A0A0C5VVX1_9GAMM|nr:hypothetical Protein YC6258_05438 [Gynuella sunshinyii YC6258]